MLQQVLNRHSQIAIPPETGFFSDFVGRSRRRQASQVRRINADLKIDLPAPTSRVAFRIAGRLLASSNTDGKDQSE